MTANKMLTKKYIDLKQKEEAPQSKKIFYIVVFKYIFRDLLLLFLIYVKLQP